MRMTAEVGVCVDDGREIPGLSVLGPNPGLTGFVVHVAEMLSVRHE
jgi:hypothetical protein